MTRSTETIGRNFGSSSCTKRLACFPISSSDSFREQVRVSKEAVRKGITFEQVGNSYIKQFKKNPDIKAVKMIFLTTDDPDYAEMKKDARKVRDITKTLSKILEGMSTDCHT